MYTGHVAIALAVRGVRRDVPLWVLVLAAQAPDWVEVMCGGLGTRESTQLWSHAFPFVLIGAVAAACLVRLWTRSTGAALVAFAIYLSHPLADLITGHKPLWLGGPAIGLQLIDRPVPDFVVQSALCVLGWVIYRRSLQSGVRGRLIAAAPLVMLLALQGASDLVVLARKPSGTRVAAREGDWRLATGDWRLAASRGAMSFRAQRRRRGGEESPSSRQRASVPSSGCQFPVPGSRFPVPRSQQSPIA
ncbi:MAG TPA: hypothetical protein VL308_14045 [Gemmatimonadaceae bacterium]|nr:hypothetical protein [Gemmatimonadaceae bacterium]